MVWIHNQFGPQDLRIGQTRRLCLPSVQQQPRLGRPQRRVARAQATLDHLLCYRATSGRVAFAPRSVQARDAFGTKRATLGPPSELCLPTRKNSTRSQYPTRHLVCYEATLDNKPPVLFLDTQFGGVELDFVRSVTFCVPSLKVFGPALPPDPPPEPPPPDPPRDPEDGPQDLFASGRWAPYAPMEADFTVRFNQATNGFRIVLPGNRTITNDLPPEGFTCTPSGGTYDCTGNLPANTEATGRLQMDPPPEPDMGGDLFGRRNGDYRGPFPIAGP